MKLPLRVVSALALAGLFGVALSGCGSATDPDVTPVVAVSVLPQAWFVERIVCFAIKRPSWRRAL